MTVEDLVMRLSQVMECELNAATRAGMTMEEMSTAQVLVARVILADPLNAPRLNIGVDFQGPTGQQN
jgi:hypothetical protein